MPPPELEWLLLVAAVGILTNGAPDRRRTMDLAPEVEAFIRWLAMNPHKLADYKANPTAFLNAANLGEDARATLEGWGPESVARGVMLKAEEIYSAPEAASPNTYGRDESAKGFGAKG
jgi:hypothetical protein